MKPPMTPHDIDKPEGLRQHLDKLVKVLGNISFGSTVPTSTPAAGTAQTIIDHDMNFDGHKVIATSPAAPNTEFAVNHSLNRIPIGFVFLGGSNQGQVFKGTTAWTKTQIFLKETQGSNTFTLLIV